MDVFLHELGFVAEAATQKSGKSLNSPSFTMRCIPELRLDCWGITIELGTIRLL
jgi:hypothetical protein